MDRPAIGVTAFVLVLVAAFVHPAWNLLAKRASGIDRTTFIWLTSALSTIFYVPVVVALVTLAHTRVRFDLRVDLAMVVGTAVLHLTYFVLLQRSYRGGEFSLVYPVARGTAPLISAVAAISLFGERLSGLHVAGICIIVVSIFVIAGGGVRAESVNAGAAPLARSLGYGIATGLAIASYTLWDKEAVSVLAISPILYDFGRTAFQAALLSPSVVFSKAKRDALRVTWREFRGESIGVAILSPTAYVFVLYALTTAPVSVVAPLRESSIIIGACAGALFFGEGQLRRRVFAATLMLAGIIALTRPA